MEWGRPGVQFLEPGTELKDICMGARSVFLLTEGADKEGRVIALPMGEGGKEHIYLKDSLWTMNNYEDTHLLAAGEEEDEDTVLFCCCGTGVVEEDDQQNRDGRPVPKGRHSRGHAERPSAGSRSNDQPAEGPRGQAGRK